MAVAYGAFGDALRPIGILVSIPLLIAAIAFVMGAPWICLMWIGAFIVDHFTRNRDRTATERIS
jgi:hypothetical protein